MPWDTNADESGQDEDSVRKRGSAAKLETEPARGVGRLQLDEIEAAVAGGRSDLGELGFWRLVGRIKRDPALVEAHADQVGRIDTAAKGMQPFREFADPLRLLPIERYVFAEWRMRRAGLDYHVEIERHYYSVPYRFAREPQLLAAWDRAKHVVGGSQVAAPPSTPSGL